MSQYNPQACLSVPGRLCVGPAQLVPAAAPAFGTTWTGISSGGNMTFGNHTFAFSYVYRGSGVETLLSPTTTLFINGNGQASWLPSGAVPPGVSVNLYMTKAGTTTPFYLLASQAGPAFGGTFTKSDSQLVTLYGGGTAAISGYPGGGTALGYVEKVDVVTDVEYAWALSESTGARRAKTYRGGTWATLVFTLDQYDPDVLNQVWAYVTTSAGGYAGANVLSPALAGRSLQPGLVTPGSPLVFWPDNPEYPAALFYAPAWRQDAMQRLAFALNRPLMSIVVVDANLDSQGYDLVIGRLEDLDLTK